MSSPSPPASSSSPAGEAEADIAQRTALMRLLGLAGFSALFSMRISDAMLPELAATFGVATSGASVVIFAFASAYGLVQLMHGPLGDRYGKPRVIAIAAFVCTLTSAAAAMAPTLQALAWARAATGAASSAIMPLALAWIGDTVPAAQRQAVLARFSGWTLAGISLGTWAGGVITEWFGWRAAFALLVVMFGAMAVQIARRQPPAPPRAEQPPYLKRVAALLASPHSRTVLAAVCVEGLFGFGFVSLVPTVLHRHFALSLAQGGATLALFAGGGVLFSRLSPWFLARFPPAAQARLGGALMGLGFAIFAVMPHGSWAVAACPIAGFGFYCAHNTLQTAATQMSTTSRGLAVSLFGCSLFIGQSIGVPIAARLFESAEPAWGFCVAGLGLSAVGFGFGRHIERRSRAADIATGTAGPQR